MKWLLLIILLSGHFVLFGFKTTYADSIYKVAAQKPKIEGLKLMLDQYYPVFNKSYEDGLAWSELCLSFSIKNHFRLEEGRSRLNLGVVHYLSGDYENAILSYQKALDVFEELDNKCFIGRTCNEMAVYFRKQNLFEKSLISLDRSLQACIDCNDQECVETSYNNRGGVYQLMGNTALALKSYRKAESIATKNENEIGLSYIYNNLADVYQSAGIKDSFIYYTQKSTAIREKLNDVQGVAINAANLGVYFIDENKFKQAKIELNKSLSLSKEVGYLELEKYVYGQLFELNKKQGDLNKAIYYLELSNNLRDSLLSLEKVKTLSDLEVRYETEKVKKEYVEEQKKRADAELIVANRNLWIIGLSALAIIAGLLFFVLFQRRIKKANEEKNRAVLKEKEQGISAVFDATEEERQRIAKDLHDSVGQQMSGVKMAWETMTYELNSTHPEKSVKLKELSNVLDQAAEELREISHQMMPKTLEEFGLSLALKEMLEKSLKHTPIKYEFEEFNIQSRFKKRIELSLYRISQELTNNVIKHSGASKLSIQLFQNQNRLILIVEDNGAGFNSENNEGHGLLNIKSRLDTINGLVNYEASTQSGTIATVSVNLDSEMLTSY